jgi:thiol:disulfide interchange protein DsbD
MGKESILILRHLITLILLLCLPAIGQAQWFSSSSSNEDFLPVLEAFQPTAWHDGETLFVGFENADGYYLYRHRFAVETSENGVELGDPELPTGLAKSDEFLGDVNVFYDSVVFEVPLESVYRGPLDITLTFQGCADAGLCYPPERVDLEASERSAPAAFVGWNADDRTVNNDRTSSSDSPAFTAPQSEDGRFSALMNQASLPLILALFFLAGLGLTFTPCVLPMIPILSSIIVGQNPGRPRAFALSASYVGGMSLTYAAVGVLMGIFGAGLNLQAHLQSAPVLIGFAILFALFAMAMFGTFNPRLSPVLASRIDAWQTRAQRSGPAGLALAGALSVLVVSPCVSAPLAGALVFISTSGNALMGGAALFALALGMGIPLLVVGTFGTTLLPRTGAWMNGIKIAFGILLLGVAIWLIERLVSPSVALLLWAGLAIGSALALGALTVNQPAGWPRVRQTAGVLLLAWGLTLVIGAAAGGQDPLRPLAGIVRTDTTAAAEITTVSSLEDFEAALARASDDNQPAFVHVTADWCISCKVMERQVYPTPEVAEPLSAFSRINLDVTETSDASRALLDRFELFGPPSLLFFDERQELRQARIQGEVRAPALSEHLESVLEWLNTQRS